MIKKFKNNILTIYVESTPNYFNLLNDYYNKGYDFSDWIIVFSNPKEIKSNLDKINQLFKKISTNNKSLVIVNPEVLKDKLLKNFVVVPTVIEAMDIIEIERIEREI